MGKWFHVASLSTATRAVILAKTLSLFDCNVRYSSAFRINGGKAAPDEPVDTVFPKTSLAPMVLSTVIPAHTVTLAAENCHPPILVTRIATCITFPVSGFRCDSIPVCGS